ncbi:MAG: aminoacetone oxidase family FAD-binding enzyme [Planctomycetota bacterium]|nr:MAG: aminoacetone oxidase family FAD-binding enzyme [Planctomycetota bacterium]
MIPVAVVGGGAAGLLAARFAAAAGAGTVLLEGQAQCGRKILISGGGRANLLPTACEPGDFFTSGSTNVIRRLLRTWPLPRLRSFFEQDLDLPLVEEPDGKLFPAAGRARPVRDRLVQAAAAAGAEIRTGWRLDEAATRPDGGFRLRSETGDELAARTLVLATGGRSLPETGSDGHGLEIARRLGHGPIEPYPALVPLTTRDRELTELAGISLPVRWRAVRNGRVVEERVRELLFTHRGFSGPAVLDASHHAVRDGADILVAWQDGREEDWRELFNAKARRELRRLLADHLPDRLADLLIARARLRPSLRCGNLTRGERARLIDLLCSFRLPVAGDEGWRKAEVSGGGVPLEEIAPSTLESRRRPGLFLCGEILDVIGRIGGFNFLWAWITGRLAGESAARRAAGVSA